MLGLLFAQDIDYVAWQCDQVRQSHFSRISFLKKFHRVTILKHTRWGVHPQVNKNWPKIRSQEHISSALLLKDVHGSIDTDFKWTNMWFSMLDRHHRCCYVCFAFIFSFAGWQLEKLSYDLCSARYYSRSRCGIDELVNSACYRGNGFSFSWVQLSVMKLVHSQADNQINSRARQQLVSVEGPSLDWGACSYLPVTEICSFWILLMCATVASSLFAMYGCHLATSIIDEFLLEFENQFCNTYGNLADSPHDVWYTSYDLCRDDKSCALCDLRRRMHMRARAKNALRNRLCSCMRTTAAPSTSRCGSVALSPVLTCFDRDNRYFKRSHTPSLQQFWNCYILN